jgi:predicted transcriptional regulator YdeE
MKTSFLSKDIKTFYVTAASFPDGIMNAFQTLHKLLQGNESRNFFGISYPGKNGTIIYKAAVEELYDAEAEKSGCETFIIPKGEYLCETLIDWRKDMTVVGKTFQKMLADPRIDQNGFCLEEYLGEKDMRCMIKIKE